jgi:uncharacterized delta-60 repeat protein
MVYRSTTAAHTLDALEPRQLLSAGDLARSFGRNGVLVLNDLPAAGAVHVRPDGKILVGASSQILRFNPDGSPDKSFGNNGRINTGIDFFDMEVTEDGHIVVVANDLTASTTSWDWTLARYDPDGSPDTSFNGTGKVVHTQSIPVYAMAVQPDGKILLTGEGVKDMNDGGPPASAYVAFRLSADGSFDSSFGTNGRAVGNEGHRYGASVPSDIILLPDGKFEVVGFEAPHGGGGYANAYSFDASGNTTSPTHFYPEDAEFDTGAVRDDGQVVLVGTANDASYDWLPGEPLTFAYINGDAHLIDFNPAGGDDGAPRAVVRGPENTVYIAGTESGAMGVVRLNPDGSPDESFGFGGTAYLRPKRFWSRMAAYDADLAPDGDVITAGSITLKGGKSAFVLARFQGGADEAAEQPPLASLRPRTFGPDGGPIAPVAGEPRFQFEVLYAADDQINLSTLGNADVLVTGPNGYRQLGKLEGSSAIFDDNRQVAATYSIPAPGVAWGADDNGRYRVLMRRRGILDNHGQSVRAGQIGAFRVNLNAAQTTRSFTAHPNQPLFSAKRVKRDPVFLA